MNQSGERQYDSHNTPVLVCWVLVCWGGDKDLTLEQKEASGKLECRNLSRRSFRKPLNKGKLLF
jgi:hypothetical protein